MIKYCLFFALAAVGLILRFGYIQQIPLAYYHDELDYVLTGESLARYGSDLSGTWNPWSLRPAHTKNVLAELTPVIHAAVQSIFGLGVASGHLPAAIFGLFSVLAAGWVVWLLFGNASIAAFFMLILWISPWHVHISRTGYEAGISLFFQLIAVGGLLAYGKNFRRSRARQIGWLSLSILGIIIGFFTYHGAKITIPVLTLVTLAIIYLQHFRKNIQSFIAPACLVVCAVGALLLYTQHGISQNHFEDRQSELIFSGQYLSEVVNQTRLLSLSFPGSQLAINKATVLFWEATKRWTSVFDLNRLVSTGLESGFQFSLYVHGFWYVSWMMLLIIGSFTMIKHDVTGWKPWLALIVLSPVASVLSISYQSIFRSAFTYAIILAPIAFGLQFLWRKYEKKPLILVGICGVLILETLWFGTQYFGRYGIISADNHYFEDRLLSAYVRLASQENQEIFIGIDTPEVYRRARAIIAYNNLLGSLTQSERKQFENPDALSYSFGSITVSHSCPDSETVQSSVLILRPEMLENCDITPSGTTITVPALASPIDSGTYFLLLNDTVCHQQQKATYVYTKNLNDYAVESLSATQFCSTWVKPDEIRGPAELKDSNPLVSE